VGNFLIEEDDSIHSNLETRFAGLGLGFKGYCSILKHRGMLKSCYHHASHEAKYVWKKLIKYFPYETDFFSGVLTMRWKDCNLDVWEVEEVT
jgi:hypothetical protein